MNVLGIRFCTVSAEAEDIANFLGQGLGLPEKRFADEGAQFSGVVFPAGESWMEVWPARLESQDIRLLMSYT